MFGWSVGWSVGYMGCGVCVWVLMVRLVGWVYEVEGVWVYIWHHGRKNARNIYTHVHASACSHSPPMPKLWRMQV